MEKIEWFFEDNDAKDEGCKEDRESCVDWVRIWPVVCIEEVEAYIGDG